MFLRGSFFVQRSSFISNGCTNRALSATQPINWYRNKFYPMGATFLLKFVRRGFHLVEYWRQVSDVIIIIIIIIIITSLDLSKT